MRAVWGAQALRSSHLHLANLPRATFDSLAIFYKNIVVSQVHECLSLSVHVPSLQTSGDHAKAFLPKTSINCVGFPRLKDTFLLAQYLQSSHPFIDRYTQGCLAWWNVRPACYHNRSLCAAPHIHTYTHTRFSSCRGDTGASRQKQFK